ncbi:MAG: DUF58 domain-containing protein [Oscillospiraceae bacterium]|nr:DUF58 domain-containing protein [Oscillospiraceae bacterium]
MILFLGCLLLFFALYALQLMLYTRFGLKHIHYRCYFDREEVDEGDTVDLIEEIENNGLLPLPWLKSEYAVPKHLSFAGTHSVVTGNTRFVSSLFYLRPYSRIERRWHITCTQRGEFRVESVRLMTSDLLGTARLSAPADDLGESLTVLPACNEVELGELSRRIAFGELIVPRSLLTDPVTVSGTRPYTGREALRRMDWKTSARTGQFMVRTEEHVQERRICVCFTAQIEEFGRRFASEETAERTIRMAAGLFRLLTERGEVFSVQSNCTVHGDRLATLPGCSPGYYHQLLQNLAALDILPEQPLSSAVEIPPDTHVIVLAPYESEDVRRICERCPGAEVITA